MTTNTARHFYRCIGCLEVVALTEQQTMERCQTRATCATCAQRFEYMGRVQVDRLVQEHTRCKCDDRCTSARGPICNCKCGGANHGAGMLGYVRVAVDVGAVPVIQTPSATRAAIAGRQYQEFTALLAVAAEELKSLLDRKIAGQYLQPADYTRLLTLRRAIHKANDARVHAARMKTLRALVSLPMPPTPVAAVAAEVTHAIQTAPALADAPFTLTAQPSTRAAKQESLF
jgi:hypothetical protein